MGHFEDNFDYYVFGARKGRTPRPVADYSKVDWTTKDGQTLLIADMEADHRQNCLNVLVRRHGKAKVLNSLVGNAFLFYGSTLDAT